MTENGTAMLLPGVGRWAFAARGPLKAEHKREKKISAPKSLEKGHDENTLQAEEALNRYGNSILRLAYSYLHSKADAEAVLQDTLIRLMEVAACFALLLAGTLEPFLLRESVNGPETDLAAPVGGMEEMASAGELARAVGFPVEELSGLPVKAEKVEYLSCFGELAQITWSGAEGTAVFRKTAGSGDPSGDYNSYETVARREVGEIQVTLKGQGDKISLAVWESGGGFLFIQHRPAGGGRETSCPGVPNGGPG